MSRVYSRRLPSVSTGQRAFQREAGPTHAQDNSPWGELVSQWWKCERYWVQRRRQLTKRVIRNCNGCKTVSSKCLCKPPSRKSTEGQNRRFFAISSNRSRLRWTYQVPSQGAERGEGIHRAVCMQPDKGTILGIDAGPHHGGIHRKPKVVVSKTRKAGKDLFR